MNPEIEKVLNGESDGCIVCGDCLEIMADMPDGCVDAVEGEEGGEADAQGQRPRRLVTITDPPYGCGKADWDDSFPQEWYSRASAISQFVCIITGSCGLVDSIPLVGADFVDVIAARNLNGMTRGPIGFGNWLAAVVAGGKPGQGTNAFDFTVSGTMPDHPSPKPLSFMLRLVERLTTPGDLILDPFCGSGTTLVAAKKLGRRYIGIDIEPKYVQIAKNRLRDTERPLFQEGTP